jgi:Fur family transcriptional regulator, ferric uptake regulator
MIGEDEKTVQASTEHYIGILREQGCRITPIVTTVLTQLSKSRTVQTTFQIRNKASRALGYEVGNPTIYRICKRLHQIGILQGAYSTDGIMRYFVCDKTGNEKHLHFICTSCMKVQEVNICIEDQISQFVKTRLKADVQSQHIQIEGLCESCMA